MLDPLWKRFPRWIDESSIPRTIAQELGLECWLVFHAVIEQDCSENLTPGWFQVNSNDLARTTGLSIEQAENALNVLSESGRMEINSSGDGVYQARIQTPISCEDDLEAIKARISGTGRGGRCLLRYAEDPAGLDRVEAVIYLYQMTFGLKFTPRIVEDLEEIANLYDRGLIYDIFSEAHHRGIKSFSWIKSKLHSSMSSRAENDDQ
ncbi:MAG: hypothetical protein GC154_04405 [bacterium]|nr:hypothetical protein [bacterium]